MRDSDKLGDPLAIPIIPRGRFRLGKWEVEHDAQRGDLVVKGLEEMAGARPFRLPARTPEQRLEAEVFDMVANTLEGYDRCRKSVYFKEFEHTSHDLSYQPQVNSPCNSMGHEECSVHHHGREMSKKWGAALEESYPGGFEVVAFTAENVRPAQWSPIIGRFKRRQAGEAVTHLTGGVTMPTRSGFAYMVLVPLDRSWLLPMASSAWEEVIRKVGGVPATRVLEAAKDAEALEVMVELRARAEQAIPLMVAQGLLSPRAGLKILVARYDKPRIVWGRGFKDLKRRNKEPDTEPTSTDDAPDVPEPIATSALCPADQDGNGAASRVTAGAMAASGSPPSYAYISGEPGAGQVVSTRNSFGQGSPPDPPEDARPEPSGSLDRWEPCQACDEPGCLQRPVMDADLLHWTAVRRMLRRGQLLPAKNGAYVLARGGGK